MAESAEARLPAAAYVEFVTPVAGAAPAEVLGRIMRANPALPQGETSLAVGAGLMVNFAHPTQTLAFARGMIALARADNWRFPALRIGLHVTAMSRAATDNPETTLSGGSIDGAMRIAGLADPNQALASAQFQTVVVHLLKLGAGLLVPLGKRTTSSGKTVDVFAVPAPPPATKSKPAAVAAAPRAPVAPGDNNLSEAMLAAIEQALAQEIGPLAKALVQEAKIHLPDQNRFLVYLADAVPEADRRRAFLIKATQLTN
jgi:hypothetical protein